jgi:hypothetical protein
MTLFKQKPILCLRSLSLKSLFVPSPLPGCLLRPRRWLSLAAFPLLAAAPVFAQTAAPFFAQTTANHSANTAAPSPVTRGLLGCYLFDEGSGTIAYDCSGHAQTATLGGSVTSPTWSPLGLHLGTPKGGDWQWVTTPVPSASVVSFSVGFIPDTTINQGGTVINGDSQQFLTTGTALGSPTISLESSGKTMDLFEGHYPSFYEHTVWIETAGTSMWAHQVLGVTCGLSSGSPSANTYYIDGVAAPTMLTTAGSTASCSQPAITGTFVLGASPTLEVNQWSAQGTITAAFLYSVQLTAAEQAQNAAYIQSLSKSRGYTGVPVYSGSKANHVLMSGDSITDCFGTPYADCWVATANAAPPISTGNYAAFNFGLVGSSAMGSMQAVVARECAYISPGSPHNIVHIFLGTNDFGDSQIPPTNEEVGQALAYGIRSLHQCAARLGAGVKVGIATMLSRGKPDATTCQQDEAKNSFDIFLANNWRSLGADILDDYAATPMGYDRACLNTTNFQADETHPTLAGGNTHLAPIVIASNNYLASTQTYPACSTAAVTTATTLTSANICTNAIPASGPIVLTLPNCTGFNGAPFYIRSIPAPSQQGTGSASVSVAAPASQLLDGRASVVSLPTGSTTMFVSTVETYSSGGCAWTAEPLSPASTTALAASAQAVPAGASVTLTASVSVTPTVGPAPGPAPSGTVSFYMTSRFLGSAPAISSGAGTPGIATLNASTIGAPIGIFPVTAVYSGGGAYTASTSSAVPITILPAPTSVAFEAPASIHAGATLTLTGIVQRTSSAGIPTGTVTFYSGNTVLGTAALKPSPEAQGIATFTASSAGIPAGTYLAFASYSGDSTDIASSSEYVTIVVTK